MAFTHNARHLILSSTGQALGSYEELDDAVSAAEAVTAGEGEPPRAFIVHVTEVLEV